MFAKSLLPPRFFLSVRGARLSLHPHLILGICFVLEGTHVLRAEARVHEVKRTGEPLRGVGEL